MSHHQEPTPTAEPTITITLHSPADMIAVLPYLVGYHQDNTIHLVLVDGHHLKAVLHRELPDRFENVAEFVADTVHLLTRDRPAAVAVVGHGSGERVTPVMDALAPALTAQHIDVVDMIRYENGRCWSYLCSDPACCPPDGIPYDTGTSPAVAHLVAAGMVAMPDKETFEKILQPVQGQQREAMKAATDTAEARAEAMLNDSNLDEHYWFDEGRRCARECFEHLRDGRPIPAEDLAWLGILLTAVTVRDIAFTICCEDGPDVAQRFWTEVTSRIDPRYAAAPAVNLAFTALRNGAGSLARIAVNRALQAEPGNSFARLISTALQAGITPSSLQDDMKVDDLVTSITQYATRHPRSARPVLLPDDVAP
ncbi:uncharacterized protein DUF4192 [Nonomuraea fuscirosea]|uniref:Uncharacterized protein DUF4192 n=1 Tax=Nonomuraea fuscirosea TaxID=1291556 RepID=A0A2T0LXV0_9ACTN|nr:DUF4192 domain-containing protein [Nonomuraea fuscirosea]PRX48944.1 uncharacterized protein DUF4192 [Nonomuraea fuscirosea]